MGGGDGGREGRREQGPGRRSGDGPRAQGDWEAALGPGQGRSGLSPPAAPASPGTSARIQEASRGEPRPCARLLVRKIPSPSRSSLGSGSVGPHPLRGLRAPWTSWHEVTPPSPLQWVRACNRASPRPGAWRADPRRPWPGIEQYGSPPEVAHGPQGRAPPSGGWRGGRPQSSRCVGGGAPCAAELRVQEERALALRKHQTRPSLQPRPWPSLRLSRWDTAPENGDFRRR
ncbi:translation initiation factor IF-2-like [Macaca thibetana thibetana]|uniref:translation initiation factor IF-2-like n=1 Tax=Macaca thibetana thibetana TaxID=257877 RepID=UPI0021BC7466|nr:translation initiation factor IF-2-like [Macaca thibetana thibetana]